MKKLIFRSFNTCAREKELMNLLKVQLNATSVEVKDTSGGCGAMYSVFVQSPLFEGLTKIKQHRMVHEALKKEIPNLHGLTVETRKD